MYANGIGVPQDYAEAARLCQLAADHGLAEVQFNPGSMYDKSTEVPQDHAEAARLFALAADQGDAKAQCNLGVMYANSRGVPQDDAEAVRLHQLAADQGKAQTQSNLWCCTWMAPGSRRTTPRQCGCTGSLPIKGSPRRSAASR